MPAPVPLLRLASDEKLVALTRRGNPAAFEALVARYQARLLAFCRHMLSTREDAEDVLQEVFAAAYNAMIADQRTINVRPWLYRIARNRSLNHLRRTQALGVDSMDVHVAEHGTTTAEKVHRREDFRLLVADVQTLPETQRTALLLREIDALSYEQIAEAMDTTVPSVKSLLVRARVSLAEAAQARAMTCEEVRVELGEVAEGIQQRPSAPVRRHLRQCDRCAAFRKQLRQTNKALAAVFPVGPLLFLKKALLAQLGTTASAGGSAATGAVAGTAASGGATALSAGVSAVATKTAAGLAAAALVTAGAVEVRHAQHPRRLTQASVAAPAAAPPVAPVVVASRPQPVSDPQPEHPAGAAKRDKPKADKPEAPTVTPTPTTTTTTATPPSAATIFDTTTTSDPPAGTPVEGSDTTAMPPQQSGTTQSGGATAPEETPTGPQSTLPADGTAPADSGAPQPPPPAAADPAAAPTTLAG